MDGENWNYSEEGETRVAVAELWSWCQYSWDNTWNPLHIGQLGQSCSGYELNVDVHCGYLDQAKTELDVALRLALE